ncbi:MAG: hypothetical protein ACYTBS_24630 [Planctomycetota bacterium]|jgi:hypothetical protein
MSKEAKKKLVLALLIALILSAPLYLSLELIEFKADNTDHLWPLLASLGIIAIIIERSLEIFLTAFRAQRSEEMDLEIRGIKDRISKASPGGQKASKLTESLEGLQQKKLKRSSGTRVYSLWSGLFVGILVSAVGIRSLQTLIDPEAFREADSYQRALFTLVDVLLTGGILAGGSDGIHKLVEVLRAFLDKSRNSLKGETAA